MTHADDNLTGLPYDPFGTELITRLANEFFSEPDGSSSIPTSTSLVPTSTSLAPPEAPAVFPQGAGGPSPAPTVLPTGAPRYPGLAGGYPSATADTHPPVHPGLQDALSPPTGAGTLSGGHSPGSGETYPFGEPRCNGGKTQEAHAPSAAQPSPESTSAIPYFTKPADLGFPFSRHQELSTPDFYFLQSPRVSDDRIHPPASPLGHGVSLSSLNIDLIRRDFPVLHRQVNGMPLIWLDNAATTQKPQAVIDATSRFYHRDYSNIHRGAHTLAQRSTELYEAGREKVQRFIGAADPKEIVFVRGTTEAINLVAQSYGRAHVGQGDEILLTTMEHHANIVPWQMLAEQTGASLRVAPINDAGELLLDEFAGLLGPRTKLVSITQVSNALGTINPVEQIIAMAHAQGIPVLVDGAQSAPHMPVNVQAMDCDFFTFSGHKIFGPTGIGVLYGKTELLESMPPWQGGGNMIKDVTFQKTTYQGIPQKFEAGTPAIAEVVGLGAAIDYVGQIGMPAIAAYEHELLMYATHALSSVQGLRPIGTAPSKASVLSFVMDGFSNEQVARHLDRHGIAVRAGHHCAQPTVHRYGLAGTVRPSLALYNTHDEIDALVQALHQLRRD